VRILLPVDESPYSQAALRAVLTQFQPRGIQVRVLCVIEPLTGYFTAGLVPEFVTQNPQIDLSREQESKKLVKGVAAKLRQAGFTASEMVDTGDPTSLILDNAKTWRADLIVMGSHSLRGLSRLLLGSVSESVVRHAECSVEVVRVRGLVKRKAS